MNVHEQQQKKTSWGCAWVQLEFSWVGLGWVVVGLGPNKILVPKNLGLEIKIGLEFRFGSNYMKIGVFTIHLHVGWLAGWLAGRSREKIKPLLRTNPFGFFPQVRVWQ